MDLLSVDYDVVCLHLDKLPAGVVIGVRETSLEEYTRKVMVLAAYGYTLYNHRNLCSVLNFHAGEFIKPANLQSLAIVKELQALHDQEQETK